MATSNTGFVEGIGKGFANSTIRAIKTAADNLSILDENQRILMELMDPQNTSIFEIILYPAKFTIESLSHSALDSMIAKLFIQTLSIDFPKVEYERANKKLYTKGVTYPDEVSITFIEDTTAFVRQYLKKWLELIMIETTDHGLVFKSDQDGAKKNATILLNSGIKLPTPLWISLEGLRPKDIGKVTLGHESGEPLKLETTFAIDKIKWSSALDLLQPLSASASV